MHCRMILAVVVLGLGTARASAQYPPPPGNMLPPPRAYSSPSQQGGMYSVQFRQPYWRKQTFNSEAALDNFIALQTQNGWQIQVLAARPHHYTARYRLTHWGGSANLPTLPAAQQWATHLEDMGYEPRIVYVPYAP